MPLAMPFNLKKMAFQVRFHVHMFVLHTFQGRPDNKLHVGTASCSMRSPIANLAEEFYSSAAPPLWVNLTCLWNGVLALIQLRN